MFRITRTCVTAAMLVIVLSLTIALPVLAYLYRAQLTIANSTATAYTMLPAYVSVNNSWMATNGFMQADALDTRVQNLGGSNYPWMVADNKTLTATVVPASSQVNLYFVTGESDAATMDIVLGQGGYITVADNITEPSNNFTIELDGSYVDTSKSTTFVHRYQGLDFSTNSTGNINGSIMTTLDVGTTPANFASSTNDNYTSIETSNPANVSGNLTVLRVWMANLSGNYTVGSWYGAAGTYTSRDSGVNLGVVPSGYMVEYTSSNSSIGQIHVEIGDFLGVFATTCRVELDTTPGSGSGLYQSNATGNKFGAGPTAFTSIGTFRASLYGEGEGVALTIGAALTPTEYSSTKLRADSNNLTLLSNGNIIADVTLGGASVPNVGSWTFLQNVPYASNVTITVGGNRKVLFSPNTIIQGTTMPDRETTDTGGNNSGVITWGTNPAGVTVTLGGLVSAGQPSIGSTTGTSSRDLLPASGVTDWYKEPAVTGALLTNPLRPFVTIMSDTTTLTEIQAWRLFGLIMVLLVTAVAARLVPRHLIIACIAAGVAIVGMVVMTIWPLYALVLMILPIVGGWISERNPSL